jgi:hypothetical protein
VVLENLGETGAGKLGALIGAAHNKTTSDLHPTTGTAVKCSARDVQAQSSVCAAFCSGAELSC